MRIGLNILHPVEESETPDLVAVLTELARLAGHEMVVFTGGATSVFFRKALREFENVAFVETAIRSDSYIARMLCEQWHLPALAEHAGVDVLWSPVNTSPIRGVVPRATSISDMCHRRHPGDFSFSELTFSSVLSGLSARRSEVLTVPSEFSRGEIVRFAGVDPTKVLVVPPGGDGPPFTRFFSGGFRASRLTALTRSPDPYILTVSKTDPRRDVTAAVIAFGRVMARIPHRLVVVGPPGRDEASVLAAMNARNGPGRVVRIYRVDKADLAVLYQGADLFVFSSWYEGFGLPVLEAMTAGIPVLAAGCEAIREIGGNAIEYVPPGDVARFSASMLEMLDWDFRRRQRRIRLARTRADGFTWRATAQGILKACELAIALRGERNLRTPKKSRR